MSIKIKDLKILSQPLTYGSTGLIPDQQATRKMGADTVAQPAATIDLSHSTNPPRVVGSESVSIINEIDTALVMEIRQRIENGTFRIDSEEIARGILREAVLATKG